MAKGIRVTSKTGTRYKVHKLALAVALAMATTGEVQALGLGDIELHSALNEPLDAEIRLVSERAGELESAIVKLASNDAFAQAGVDRAAGLSDLNFTITRRPDGAPVIKVTSAQPVREPFLDFIVQLRWPAGRLLREYTVLLDPPVLANEAPPPLQAPRTAVAPRPAPAPMRTPPPAATISPSQSQSAPAPRSASLAASAAGTYGPTQRKDTLWNIAEGLRPDNAISVQQMMLALLRANPNAFYDNNVNNLKAGYVLRVPERELIAALSHSDALLETQRQYQRWLQAKQGVVDTAVQAGVSPPAGPETSAAPATQQPDAASRLRLVTPGGESGAGDSTDMNKLHGDLAVALETADAVQRENVELRSRLGALEEQINTLQRMLTLTDDTLGQVQERAGGVAPPETGELTPPVTESPVVPLPTLESAPAPQAVRPTPAPVVPEGLLSNPSVIAAAGGAGLLLLSLLWMMVRRRRSAAAEEEDYESPRTIAAEEDNVATPVVATASAVTAAAATAAAATSEDELHHDERMDQVAEEVAQDAAGHVQETADNLDMMQGAEGDVDPLVEADVYLAYRRFDQAEELVKKALEQNPNQPELMAKLLEVHYAAKDSDAFQATVEGFYASLGENPQDPLWLRVIPMGQELCPSHHLFASAEGAPAPSDSDDSQLFDGLGDFAVADAGAEQTGDALDLDMAAQAEQALDFDLDLGEDAALATEAGGATLADELDFGLGGAEAAQDQFAKSASEADKSDSAKEESWDVEPAMSDFGAMDFGLDDTDLLAGTDVVGTKLDLAKAYIDMGDNESAREILKEVLGEGSDEQKKEALALSDQLV